MMSTSLDFSYSVVSSIDSISTAAANQADDPSSCSQQLADYLALQTNEDAAEASSIVLGDLATEDQSILVTSSVGVASIGRRLRSTSFIKAIETATVSDQGWTIEDASIPSLPLQGLTPPLRHIQTGNALMAGILLHQVSCQ